MMETVSSIIDLLRQIADDFEGHSCGLQLYLFGSALSGVKDQGDIDVLLLYPVGCLEIAHELAMRLRSLDVMPPVEVVALSGDEVDEKQFIEVVGGELFWMQSIPCSE